MSDRKVGGAELSVPSNQNFNITKVGLTFSGVVTYELWQDMGPALGSISRAYAWSIGDWLDYGERVFPDRYSQAMDTTGLSLGRLRNLKYMASNIPLSMRRENLSLSHHEAVIPLPDEYRIQLLDLAEAKGIDRDTFRELVKEVKEAGAEPDDLEVEDQVVLDSIPTDAEIVAAAMRVAKEWRINYSSDRIGMSLHEALEELSNLIGDNYD